MFDPDCRRCSRLADFLDAVKISHPIYHARPVAAFGDPAPKLLIVGLAPGMHGANRTGRPFTGDYAGELLYSSLHRFGFATSGTPLDAGGGPNPSLQLIGCRITNAVKCLPPENKPTGDEINTCNGFLRQELATLPAGVVILALGNIAHQAVLKASKLKIGNYRFGHNVRHALPDGRVLYDSYHCSRYNTQTKRLTEAMFHNVFASITEDLKCLTST